MYRRNTVRALISISALAGALAVPMLAAAPAGAAIARVYVSPSGSSGHNGRSCQHAQYNSIQTAIDSARIGGTVVVVCRGTYPGNLTVDRRVTLEGMPGAVIDATGNAYGIGVTASWVTIRSLTVKNASDFDNGPADGIITAGFTADGPAVADHVTIEFNKVTGNLGSGIDLNSTSHSIARHNTAIGNGVGINLADDLGPPSAHNTVIGNITNQNFGGCGIALADHTGSGVFSNLITDNVSDDNGLSTPTAPDASAGSGVILASPIPGGIVRDNVISNNEFHGNGHGGVVVHSHVPNIPNLPANDFTGNVITGNTIGTNNLRTDSHDVETTGIYLGSASPMTITVSSNVISSNHYGIFTAGDVVLTGSGNQYVDVDVDVDGVPAY
jgi:parallel beta-helix repeat protein